MSRAKISQSFVEWTSYIPPILKIRKLLDPAKAKILSELILDAGDMSIVDFNYVKKLTNSSASQANDSLRGQISWESLESVNKKIPHELFNFFSNGQFSSTIIRNSIELLLEAYNKKNPVFTNEVATLNVYGRVRIFVDRKGFELHPHNDSQDTLCAIILPLKENATITSIFTNTFSDQFPELSENQEISKNPSKPNKGLYLNQSQETAWQCFYDIKTDRWKPYQKMNISEINLNPGDCVVLINPESKIISESERWIGKIASHGVFPAVKEKIRPVIIVDYMISEKIITTGYNFQGKHRTDLLFQCGQMRDFFDTRCREPRKS